MTVDALAAQDEAGGKGDGSMHDGNTAFARGADQLDGGTITGEHASRAKVAEGPG